MIDISAERVVSLAGATRLFPARRGDKKPHVSCLYRWTNAGCRGVILESIQVGGTRCTSLEAIRGSSRDCQHLSQRRAPLTSRAGVRLPPNVSSKSCSSCLSRERTTAA